MIQIPGNVKYHSFFPAIRALGIILISVAICACLHHAPLDHDSPLIIRVQGEGVLSPSEIQAIAKQAESAQYCFFRGDTNSTETLSNARQFPWAEDYLEAIAVRPIDQSAAPFPERLAAARLAARDAAWKEMGNALLGLPVSNTNKMLGGEIDASPDLRRKVEEAIRGAETEEKWDAGSSQTLCIARLPLNRIAPLLAPEEKDAITMDLPSRIANTYPHNPIENASFAKALAQAREMLVAKVTELPLHKKKTMATLLTANPAARNEARKAIESARIDVMDFPRQGECIIRLSLDATRLIDGLQALQEQ